MKKCTACGNVTGLEGLTVQYLRKVCYFCSAKCIGDYLGALRAAFDSLNNAQANALLALQRFNRAAGEALYHLTPEERKQLGTPDA